MATERKRARARGQFSDKTKAQLYAWDNAVCAMTGASLWTLDYGATSLCHYDWADHVKPRARGGSHDAGNGVSVAEEANYEKGANGRANRYAYVAGQPTWKAFATFGKVPEDTAKYLRRNVQPRDWYFNRCLANLMWYVFGHVEGWTGTRIKRKPMYYPKAAFRFIEDFRKAWHASGKTNEPTIEQVSQDFRKRGLMPASRGGDQELMLTVLSAKDHKDIARIGKKLMPLCQANERWVYRFDQWAGSCESGPGDEIVRGMRRDKKLNPWVREVIEHNIRVLGGTRMHVRDEGQRRLQRRAADW